MGITSPAHTFHTQQNGALWLQDCDGRSWGSWVQNNASAQWEAALGWPADPVWTESRWDEGIPRMELFTVSPSEGKHFGKQRKRKRGIVSRRTVH